MSMYWPGTGVSIERQTNPFGDEWFVLLKDGLELAELDAKDISKQHVFEAFSREVAIALGRAPQEQRRESRQGRTASCSKATRSKVTCSQECQHVATTKSASRGINADSRSSSYGMNDISTSPLTSPSIKQPPDLPPETLQPFAV